MIPSDGLLPRLEEGLSLFYAGLNAMSAAQGEGLDEVPDVTRNITVDGIPVTVVDTVEGGAFAAAGGAVAAAGGVAAAGSSGSNGTGRPRLTIEVVDDAAATATAAEAALEEAVAAALAEAGGDEGDFAEVDVQEEEQQQQQPEAEAVA